MSDRSRRLPVVTILLIAANILAAYGLLFDPMLVREYGFRADRPSLHHAVTCLFLHANVLHLLGNMVFLAAVGSAVELASGSVRFAIVYFVSGLCGVLVHFLAMHRFMDPMPLIGASGAVAGCAAYYSFRYTRYRVKVAPKLALSVATVVGIWAVLQVAGAFVRIGESGGVSFWSHLGGIAAGVLLSLAFRAPDPHQVAMDSAFLMEAGERSPAATVLVAKRHLEQYPTDLHALKELAEAYAAQGERESEAETLLRLIDSTGDSDQLGWIRRLAEIGWLSRLPVHRRLQLADQHPEVAPMLLRSVVDGPTEEPRRPDALLALAALEEESSESRQTLLNSLCREYPLHPAAELAKKRGWIS